MRKNVLNENILITGITSIHGWPIFSYFNESHPENVWGIKNTFAKKPVAENVYSANMEDENALKKIFEQVKPSYVIHCGGLCDLDKAEEHPEHAHKLNVEAAHIIHKLSSQVKHLTYISYDLVFSGENNNGGYSEEDIPDPLTVVGETIVLAENILQKHPKSLIIRLALPMGASIQGNKGAVDWINDRLKKGRVATLLYDEFRSTINVEDIGPAMYQLLRKNCTGIYNLGSNSCISIYGIGRKLVNAYKHSPKLLEGRNRKEFPPSPPRMGNVTLNCQKAFCVLGWIPKRWQIKI